MFLVFTITLQFCLSIMYSLRSRWNGGDGSAIQRPAFFRDCSTEGHLHCCRSRAILQRPIRNTYVSKFRPTCFLSILWPCKCNQIFYGFSNRIIILFCYQEFTEPKIWNIYTEGLCSLVLPLRVEVLTCLNNLTTIVTGTSALYWRMVRRFW